MCGGGGFLGGIGDFITGGLGLGSMFSTTLGIGDTLGALGVDAPTVPELTGQEAMKEQVRQQRKRQAQEFAAQQQEAQRRRQEASRQLARSSIRTAPGRSSTLLTGPQGVMTDASVASRTLLAG